MSKRQEIRARRRRQQLQNRILVILLVIVGALLIVFALVIPSIKHSSNNASAQITPITPKKLNAQVDGVHIGDPNAPVKMDVWEDFQCSGCLSYTKNIEPQVLKNYVETGKVYYTYHFYPLIDGNNKTGESHQAANAAMCALEQGRFWDFHDALFANWLGENVGSYTNDRLVAIAKSLNLDMTAFNACFQANKYADVINKDYDAGTAAGVHSTPAIFINGQLAVSSAGATYIPSFDDLSHTIDALLPK